MIQSGRSLSVVPSAGELDPMFMRTVNCAVVVDILRATTTILAGLSGGAKRIIPLETVEEARALAGTLAGRGEKVLLAGERGGKPLNGFDLGNSPADFVSERTMDQTILFTTTNGTLALKQAMMARELITGSFGNARAVCRHLDGKMGKMVIACAGQEGKATLEDHLFAGWVASDLKNRGFSLDREALHAREIWHETQLELEQRLLQSPHGQTLNQLGFASDIRFAAQWDISMGIPRFAMDAEHGFLVGTLS